MQHVLNGLKRQTFQPLFLQQKTYDSKEAYEKEILQQLNKHDVEFIILAGYMRLIGHTLLSAFEGKIVNIHPSLLPAFPGKDAIGQALAARVAKSGVTVHYVDEGMDTGPIIEQQEVVLDEQETLESLQEKIHAVEHILYPAVLQRLFQKESSDFCINVCLTQYIDRHQFTCMICFLISTD